MPSKIKNLKAKEILDSRGEPTVEVQLTTTSGTFKASVPSGVSTSKYEAVELRDNEKRHQGKGVLMAVRNINEIISKAIIGKDAEDQEKIDKILIELDGTKNKSKLGANAILPASIVVCRAGANKLPVWKKVAEISKEPVALPRPSILCIEGGLHGKGGLDIQEFMIIPQKRTFYENFQIASETYYALKKILKDRYGVKAVNIGDEGGFTPPISKTKEAISLIVEAIEKAGYEDDIKISLDCAASRFFKNGDYELEKSIFTKKSLLGFYRKLIEEYPIISIEDPFSEDDWEGFQKMSQEVGDKITIIGDDLLSTNKDRMKEAKKKKACNGLILKPNQIGTVTETIEAGKLAKSYGWKIMVSHRGGDTIDTFIADLAVGIGAEFIKSGSPAKKERVVKYNRLLEIEKEITS